jgi:hypothetical protein
MNDGVVRQKRFADLDAGEGMQSRTPMLEMTGQVARVVSQVVGLVLVLIGTYYAVQIAVNALHMVSDPAQQEATLANWARILRLEEATATTAGDNISIGRTVAAILVLLCYVIGGGVTLGIINAGGRLVLGVIGERREFLAAMREFMASVRAEEARMRSREEIPTVVRADKP